MSNPQQHPMYLATKRLMGALDRLEDNLQHMTVAQERSIQQEQQMILFERENVGLQHECERLNSALDQLQQQYNELHHTASLIHVKLDDSIHRLNQIIEE
jgi:hypothetical protein